MLIQFVLLVYYSLKVSASLYPIIYLNRLYNYAPPENDVSFHLYHSLGRHKTISSLATRAHLLGHLQAKVEADKGSDEDTFLVNLCLIRHLHY
ncbi:hypothetical protein NQ314_014411 [Rhamnusium bicolor]|uniref:Uncharacterized protein n=1 Tax=Rhamnusium bicolor TaxID=1586634 RepID=A0AAV8X2V7_9CUCU|nr:hypothetical protein NQ314_014411 [Rhamnusium bicolor]